MEREDKNVKMNVQLQKTNVHVALLDNIKDAVCAALSTVPNQTVCCGNF